MPGHDIIVVGASTGGVEALTRLAGGLPPDLPAAVFVVCHFPHDGTSHLPRILGRAGPLPAAHAQDGEPIRPGRLYVARPDYHLLLQPGVVRLSHGARENRFRPAIDPLFRTAARSYGRRVVAAVLTGGLNDGAAGLLAVRAAGGVAVVQEPDDALVAAMPQSALRLAGADHVVPVAAMAALLAGLARAPVPEGGDAMTDPIETMPAVVDRDMEAQQRNERRGTTSVYSCPECGGVLWQVDQRELVRFRCHVGHAYYGEQLLDEQSEALEAALWTAVRTFRERATLTRQLAEQERQNGQPARAGRYDEQAEQAERYGQLITRCLLDQNTTAPSPEVGPAPAGGTAAAPAQE